MPELELLPTLLLTTLMLLRLIELLLAPPPLLLENEMVERDFGTWGLHTFDSIGLMLRV